VSRDANDFLADAVKKNPKRFAGFASLPIQAPDKAAEELERAIRQLGFKGALINGHTRGRYLDDKVFGPILARAEALNVPIYLHPTIPPKAVVEASYGGFSPAVTGVLSSAGWGWHIETAVHLIRMILGGVFDQYPKLQVVVGHLGEGLPFMMPRMQRALSQQLTKLNRPIGDYLRQNIHYTFGGFNFAPTFLDLLLEVGVDPAFVTEAARGIEERSGAFGALPRRSCHVPVHLRATRRMSETRATRRSSMRSGASSAGTGLSRGRATRSSGRPRTPSAEPS